jgi:predicted flavoprotein YhiN
MGARVLVIDHNQEPGKKILISGGGRCNFTNIGAVPDRYLSENKHFARSALSRYTPADFVDLVRRYNIAFHEKTLGQLFCDGSAKQIVAMLMDECAAGRVDFAFGAAISNVSHADGRFTVTTSAGIYSAPNLVIATGGPAIPKLGGQVCLPRSRAVHPQGAFRPGNAAGVQLLAARRSDRGRFPARCAD